MVLFSSSDEVRKSAGFAIGIFLVAAGFLKLNQALDEILLFDAELISWYGFSLIASFVEIYAGLLAIFCSSKDSVWQILGVLFLFLASVSAAWFFRGITSCGCLGKVSSPPIAMLIIDSALGLFCLAIPRAFPQDDFRATRPLKFGFGACPGTSLLLSLLVVGSTLISNQSSLFYDWGGRNLIGSTSPVPGRAMGDGTVEASLPLRNVSAQSIEIVGLGLPCKTFCGLEVPCQIKPNTKMVLPIRAAWPEGETEARIELVMYSKAFGEFRRKFDWTIRL